MYIENVLLSVYIYKRSFEIEPDCYWRQINGGLISDRQTQFIERLINKWCWFCRHHFFAPFCVHYDIATTIKTKNKTTIATEIREEC